MRRHRVGVDAQRRLDRLARPRVAFVLRYPRQIGLPHVQLGELHPRQRIGGVERRRLLERHFGALGVALERAVAVDVALQHEVVGLDVGRLERPLRRATHQHGLERARHGAGDLVLHLEDVRQVAIVGLRPQVVAVGRANQLSADAQHLAALAHAALQHVGHPELAGDRADVFVLALERECRRAGDHPQVRAVRQALDQLLGQAVGEMLLVALLAHVGKRQHGDRLVLHRHGGLGWRHAVACGVGAAGAGRPVAQRDIAHAHEHGGDGRRLGHTRRGFGSGTCRIGSAANPAPPAPARRPGFGAGRARAPARSRSDPRVPARAP